MKIAFVMYPGACFLGKVDGTKMQSIIWKEALEDKEECLDASFSFKTMLPLAIATSIDALAVGIALVAKGAAFSKSFTSNIFFDVFTIGITTFVISSLGIKIGNVFGTKHKKKAEIAGGIILIALGIKMFFEHFI